MSATVFVDTNVFVYARDASEPRKQPLAAEWVRALWVEQRGRTSMQVLSEYYVTVTHKLDPGLASDDAWDDVRTLMAWEPQEIGRDIMLRGRELERRFSLSWWDSLIVAAAQLQNCSLLLTEDLHDGLVCGTVTIRNPFTESVADQMEAYAVERKPRSRHRRPGRPRSQAG